MAKEVSQPMVQRACVRSSEVLWGCILPPFLGDITDSHMRVFPDIFVANVALVSLYFLIVPVL